MKNDFLFIVCFIGAFFVLWLIGGGPSRTNNKDNPFIEPIDVNEKSKVYNLDQAKDDEIIRVITDSQTDPRFDNPFASPFATNTNDTSTQKSSEGAITQTQIKTKGHTYYGWYLTNTGDGFTILLPKSWYASKKPSLDNSKRGSFTNGTITLIYEYGNNVNELNYEKTGAHEIRYGTISGKKAKFVRPTSPLANTTGTYIKRTWGPDLSIVTNTELTQDEENLVFAIINTVSL